LADTGDGAVQARTARLEQLLVENAEQLAVLERQHAEVLAASVDSNAMTSTIRKGATIAFERQQLAALRQQVLRTRAELQAALDDGAAYVSCRSCGRDIGAERLAARPSARTCVDCASRSSRGGRYRS
jgi:RNA polymerase-binding transcription factor DksA